MPTLESALHDLEAQGYTFVHTDTPNHTLAEYRASRSLDQLLADVQPYVIPDTLGIVLFIKDKAQCTLTNERVVVDAQGCWVPESRVADPTRPEWLGELLENWNEDIEVLKRYGATAQAEVLSQAYKELHEISGATTCCECDDCTCEP